MKNLIIAVISLFTVTAFAQTEKQLIGKWKFMSLADAPDLDEDSKKMAGEIFKDFALEFSENKVVTFSMLGKSETGTWSYNETEKTVIMTSAKKKDLSLPIQSYSEQEMTVNFQGKAKMVLKRI